MPVNRFVLYYFCIFSILMTSCLKADEQSVSGETPDISGVYLRAGSFDGLLVKKLDAENYIFRRIAKIENEIRELEWQGAFVSPDNYPDFTFYWHTGRYEDIPGSNAIIVYKLKFLNNILSGYYFFPENLENPGGKVKYIKSES